MREDFSRLFNELDFLHYFKENENRQITNISIYR